MMVPPPTFDSPGRGALFAFYCPARFPLTFFPWLEAVIWVAPFARSPDISISRVFGARPFVFIFISPQERGGQEGSFASFPGPCPGFSTIYALSFTH